MSNDPQGPNEFISDAYALDNKEGLKAFYRKWATEYDAQMASEDYLSPIGIARSLVKYLPTGKPHVIDIGCGTGLTGLALVEVRPVRLDGLDISPEMINLAMQRGIYQQCMVADLTASLAIESDRYDAAICSGTFTHAHVGPEAVNEIIRILKPGGLFACTVHFKLWQSAGFKNQFDAMIADSGIYELERKSGAYYEGAEDEGWFCVYRKSKANPSA